MTNQKPRPRKNGAASRRPRWKANRDVVAQRLGDDLMLVQLATDRIYSLNGTAARLWELAQRGLSERDIEARLRREFQVDAVRLRKEIARTLAAFAKNDLLVASSNGRIR